MKASEYAQFYTDEIAGDKDPEQALLSLARKFVVESAETMNARHISTDIGAVGVMREYDQKWQALCRIMPQLNRFWFCYWVHEDIKEMWDAWEKCFPNDMAIKYVKVHLIKEAEEKSENPEGNSGSNSEGG